jgi:hypothetical protein
MVRHIIVIVLLLIPLRQYFVTQNSVSDVLNLFIHDLLHSGGEAHPALFPPELVFILFFKVLSTIASYRDIAAVNVLNERTGLHFLL